MYLSEADKYGYNDKNILDSIYFNWNNIHIYVI